MVSPVMAAMAWRMLFGVKYGAINNLGRQLGIIDVYFDWFGSTFISIVAIVLVEVWHNTPFMMLVLLAGLQSIPQELYEAAKADGASPAQSFWHITLPLLKFTMAVGMMIRLIDLTKLFGLIFVLTFGGPGQQHRDGGLQHVPRGLQRLPHELRGRALLSDRRGHAGTHPGVPVDHPCARAAGGLMAIATEATRAHVSSSQPPPGPWSGSATS